MSADKCFGGHTDLFQGQCDAGWYQVGQSCYQVVTEGADFNTAQQRCADRGGRLAWIKNRNDMCAITRLIDTVESGLAQTMNLSGLKTMVLKVKETDF